MMVMVMTMTAQVPKIVNPKELRSPRSANNSRLGNHGSTKHLLAYLDKLTIENNKDILDIPATNLAHRDLCLACLHPVTTIFSVSIP